MKSKVLLVGPINDQGLGGRFEEMRVWARFLEQEQFEVSVFSMFNSRFGLENAIMVESVHLVFPTLWSWFPRLRNLVLRVWSSRFFRNQRNDFYNSEKWYAFAHSFNHLVLFITHQSKEIKIFESSLPVPVSIRFTGTVHDFSALKIHHKKLSSVARNYIIHAPGLFHGFENSIPKVFIDQTTLAEKSLLDLKIDSNLKIFAMIGLFMEVKQMEQVITVFANLPNLNLIIFGTGALQTSYQAKIDALGLSNVKIAGFIAPDQISQLYTQIDALIINSAEETGPMTGIEAMASGKLIFSRPVGAMRERLSDPEMIFDNTEDLTEKIRRFSILPPERIIEYKTTLRKRYLENYSNLEVKKQIKNMLEEVSDT
ncbi:Glycosyltransferase involved in cell wall bisynthesis [Algoriphagus alkaliphilus]|uniref:Glycosyltransferase involved in cell wall bisynthesis n=1 Tax=Algoriphagus alkaliphilus TaxID=279824 RepID=A0A1G5Y7I2_9BACT|nr:glycosyltransferase [Algoriphagus alkaliphilus]SDA78007.1 Glycosyltransferase involved in cell wall bisynthesis [Algoriphagus alkaliphilus]